MRTGGKTAAPAADMASVSSMQSTAEDGFEAAGAMSARSVVTGTSRVRTEPMMILGLKWKFTLPINLLKKRNYFGKYGGNSKAEDSGEMMIAFSDAAVYIQKMAGYAGENNG